MATKVIVFPVRGRRWCFSALAPSAPLGKPSGGVASVSQLWNRLVSLHRLSDRAELMEQFVSTKMQDKWAELGAQPSESIRHRIYSIGERLLSRIPPQEQFLKTLSKDTPKVELVFPSSLNPRLVRRRVRHLAHSGTVYHRKLMFGSMALLPFTVLLGILPLPNVTFFWNLFRAHAHWRALQGSTRLQMLVTDSATQASIAKHDAERKDGERSENTQHAGNAVAKSVLENGQSQPWVRSTLHTSLVSRDMGGCMQVFVPSSELESLVKPATVMSGAISESAIAAISREFKLDSTQILSWSKAK